MNIGSYAIVRQPKSRARWKTEQPEFEPCWVVRFRIPGQSVKVESSRLGICDLCLAEPSNPTATRERCRCIGPVRQWADAKLKAMGKLWHEGRIEELERVTARRVDCTIGRLVDTFAANIPKGGYQLDYVAGLWIILREALGVEQAAARRLPVTVLTLQLAVDWMTLRWHHNAERGLPSPRSWEQLRAALKAGQLAAPPRNVASPGNYTINGLLTKVRALIGETSRTHYLRGLELPALTFTQSKGLVAARGQHQALDRSVVAAIYASAEEALATGDRDWWVAVQLTSRYGLRPIEVLAARTNWIERQEDGEYMLHIRNRQDEQFSQKARARAVNAQYSVPAEVAEVLLQAGEGQHLFAPGKAVSTRDKLMERIYSTRLRQWIPEGKDTWYAFRKLYVSMLYAAHGKEAARHGARHASSDVTESHYAVPLAHVPSVNPLERV
jgi:plasmid stability protein